MTRFPCSLALLSGTLLLGACSQTAAPAADPMQPFTTQTIQWQPCDPSVLGTEDSDTDAAFAALGSRLTCANIQVPVDYAHPASGAATFSLLRVTAEQPAHRQGAIFFNPGGPGGDGLGFAVQFGNLWGNADTSAARGQNFKQLAQQFDLIGFSPRGVGGSTQLYCATNELQAPVNYESADRSDTNISAMLRNARLTALACQKNPLTPFINTDATARDLDLTRTLLGEEKLNYIGYSYGTWLGAWYAKLFPAHTGRFLLDGNMDFSSTMEQSALRQPEAFERDFRQVVLPYVARQNQYFELGTDAATIGRMYDALPTPLRQQVAGVVQQQIYQHSNMPLIGIALVGVHAAQQLMTLHPDQDPATLALDAATLPIVSNSVVNAQAQEAAAAFLSNYAAVANPQSSPTAVAGSDAVFSAVTCNDSPWSRDPQATLAEDNRQASAFPLIGGRLVRNPCYAWGAPTVQKPAVPAGMPPLLMLQNEYDPATPAVGGLAAWKATPNARMLFINHESQHAAFPYDTDCVDLPITRYFLTGTLPDATYSACEAVPLPLETKVYPAADAAAQGVSPQGLRVSAFKPAAQDSLSAIRRIIARNAKLR